MRALISLCLLLTACGGGETTLLGEMAEEGITHVWVVGGPERATVSGGTFRLEGLRGDTLDLRFAAEGEERARMEILGHAGQGTLNLRGIWVHEGVAHPTAAELQSGGVVRVNGLRLGGADELPRDLDVRGAVLAASGAGDALLVRPGDERFPDLRVVVTPGTLARTPDGDPADLEELGFGDTVRVRGVAESGYVIAAEVEVPRSSGREAPDDAGDRRSNGGAAGGAAAAAAARPAGAAGGSGERTTVRERIRKGWDRARGKGGAGKGKGKGKEKGKG